MYYGTIHIPCLIPSLIHRLSSESSEDDPELCRELLFSVSSLFEFSLGFSFGCSFGFSFELSISRVCMSIYAQGHIGGWGGESNWEIVSSRPCVRARGALPSEIQVKN